MIWPLITFISRALNVKFNLLTFVSDESICGKSFFKRNVDTFQICFTSGQNYIRADVSNL